jgi:hypothetical protein
VSAKDDRAPGEPSAALAKLSVALPSGRRLAASVDASGADVIRVHTRGGECVLTVRVTDEGPVLRFSGAALEIDATRSIDLSCETLRLSATGDASIEVGGDLTERVGGGVRREARSMAIEARPGGIVMKANDDLDLKGERVLLNSDDPPMPLTMAEYRARILASAPAALPAKEED